MAKEWAATEGPDGLRLGRWVQKTEMLWEEAKVGVPQQVEKYAVVTGDPVTKGSSTIHLRKLGGDGAEVFIVGSSILCFAKGGKYVGEYTGSWQGAGLATAAAPAAVSEPTAAPPAAKAAPPGSTAPAPSPPPAQETAVTTPATGGDTAPASAPGPAPSAVVDSAGNAAPAAPTAPSPMPAEAGATAPPAQKAAGQAAKPQARASVVVKPKMLVPSASRKKKGEHLRHDPALVEKLKTAVLQKDAAAVKKLVTEVDFDEVGRDGKTPVFVAVELGSPEILKILLDAGADAATGFNGKTPLTVAHQKGNKEVLNMLFKAAFQTIVPDGMPGEVEVTTADAGIDGFEDDEVKLLENESSLKGVMFGITRDAQEAKIRGKTEKIIIKDCAEELSETQESQIKDVMKMMARKY